MNSPGGFALLRVLDSCLNNDDSISSPPQIVKKTSGGGGGVNMDTPTRRLTEVHDNDASKQSGVLSTISQGSRLDDWHEASLRLPSFFSNYYGYNVDASGAIDNGCHSSSSSSLLYHTHSKNGTRDAKGGSGVDSSIRRSRKKVESASLRGEVRGMVDWSLKRMVKIECHPCRCLPGTFTSEGQGVNASVGGGHGCDFWDLPDEGRAERLAYELFTRGYYGGRQFDCNLHCRCHKDGHFTNNYKTINCTNGAGENDDALSIKEEEESTKGA